MSIHKKKSRLFLLQGAGTDESTIIEILCARTDEQIEEIKTKYNEGDLLMK